jgi:hypothetical protein
VGDLIDALDSWFKGGVDYLVHDTGPWVMTYRVAAIAMSAIGMRVRSIRCHAAAGVALLLLDFATSVVALPRLGF